ncbi:MAG TPA: GlsB/YeaQ/YmgE family stress response membrane protein [Atopostipes sp.]|nr:GlsB/YeaQ/YmgE family stress response membrane protein [Atopostipes sp.]
MWSLILSLIVGGLIGWVAEFIMKRDVPGGVIGNIVLGFLGSWVGGLIFADLGPTWEGFAIIPSILGALLVVFIFSLIAGKARS